MLPAKQVVSRRSLSPLSIFSEFIHVFLHRAEIDRAVIFAILARGWQFLAGTVTLLLIARYFTKEQQGFHYTFASLVALQSFFELGLSLVIVNVASHEWSWLRLDLHGRITGDSQAFSRLVSLGRLIFKWYVVSSALFISCVGIAGWLFVRQTPHADIHWEAPWTALVVFSGLLLWTLPFNSLLEGCNQVAITQRFSFIQAVLSSLAIWGTLALGGGLWAAAASVGVRLLCNLYLILIQYRRFFAPFFKLPTSAVLNWRREIWPMQWRVAISGFVNYFAFSLFTPVMFQYYGSAVAGQMGMTWQIVSATQLLAQAWVLTKVPHFGMLVSKEEYVELDRYWLRVSLISMVVVCLGSGGLWMVIYSLNTWGVPLAGRILPLLPTSLFLLAGIFYQVSQCLTAYLFAHKKHPFVVMSVTASLLTGFLVWFLGGRWGPTGAAVGYLAIVAGIIVPWETAIWFRCRKEWHKN